MKTFGLGQISARGCKPPHKSITRALQMRREMRGLYKFWAL
jgi:hypothetical protein